MKILHVHMVTPAVYKAYTCTSTFYLHLLLPRQHQRTERKKKEVENERRENKCRHFVCVAIQHGPCLSKRSNSFCITSTSYPLLTPPTRSICSIALQVPSFIQTIQTKPLKRKRKKRTAPYHSCTSSWLLSSMSVVWRDSWFMSNSHQSCRKMLA